MEIHQGNDLTGQVACAEPVLVGVADGVARSPQAERMSRRLLQCCAVAYQHGRTAFNAKLIRRAQRLLSLPDAGGRLPPESASTIVLAEIRNGMVTVLNTGDSRAYVIDKTTGEHRRVTKDHTTFELLKDDGEIPADAQDCDFGSIAMGVLEAVTAAHMGDEDFLVHMGHTRLQKDEVVLLCSDGVTGHLSDARIGDSVAFAYAFDEDPGQCIIELVERAGAEDNTTVVVEPELTADSEPG
jgi:protein phosphatase